LLQSAVAIDEHLHYLKVLRRPIESTLSLPITMVLTPGPEHMHVVAVLLESAGGGGDLVPDAHLAALAIENGGTVYSQDAVFARFLDVRWVNPLAG
jgi:predicted nucleic acid-binding protein